MEQQFILRLPEQLQHIDLGEARFVKHSGREVSLVVQGATYPGVVCRLPTIVESHKEIDSKLYKVSDISTLVVVFAKKEIDVDAEIARIESNGLVPPMAGARERWSHAPGDAETVERRVAEMLREDARAEGVEILEGDQTESEREGSSGDLDMLAAEIENDMPAKKGASVMDMGALDLPSTGGKVQRQNEGAPGHGTSVSRQAGDADTCHEEPAAPGGLGQSSSSTPAGSPDPGREDGIRGPAGPAARHPALVDIENKIKEKQELLSKALNPILKKRFSQAIADLQDEYEAKKKELSGL